MFCKDSLVGELRDTQEVLSTRSLPSSIPKINITTNLPIFAYKKIPVSNIGVVFRIGIAI
jgi:hypothetical protein